MYCVIGGSTAAIVWGIPVKPVDLLYHLDAFREAIPTLHTLRLCNRFGKGENAGITKLPRELVEFIGEELLALLRRDETDDIYGWAKRYGCFEGTCRPLHHLDHLDPCSEMNIKLEAAKIDLLRAHPEWRTDDGIEFPDNYDDLLESKILNRLDMYAGDVIWEICIETGAMWQSYIHKHLEVQGNRDILRKHFGLDAFIMYENLDASTIKYLERTDDRYSKGMSETTKATICYLTLPSQSARWATQPKESPEGDDCYHAESASSMLVDRSSLDLTDEHRRRFARAMLRLALKPSVHPSQLQKSLSAASTINNLSPPQQSSTPNKDLSEEEIAKREIVTTRRITQLEQSQWPKLMLLASQTISGE